MPRCRPGSGRYGAVIEPLSLDHHAFTELLARPDAPDQIREVGNTLLLVDGDGVLDPDGQGRLTTLPAVIVSISPTDAPPAWADAVAREAETVERIVTSVSTNPLASVAFALLMRSSDARDVGAGLVAESTTYSMLQGGPEFAAWRSSRPVTERRRGQVLVERDMHRLLVTLDRPEVHNALDTAIRDGLVDALQLAVFDPSITDVELSGNGPSFCSGGDLDEFGSRADPASAHLVRLDRSVARLLAELASRVTARIHGSTMGSGIEMAAFARNVIARHDTRIALPEVSLGLIPGAGGTVSLPRRIGRHRTALLGLSGTVISASTALRWGLVDEIVA